MNSIKSFLEKEFKTNIEDWESVLLKELKVTEVGNKKNKEKINGQMWPTLSLNRNNEIHVKSELSWKKASNTYIILTDQLGKHLKDDLENGVKNFFFESEELDEKKWSIIESVLNSHHTPSELEIFILGNRKIASSSLKVISNMITGFEMHSIGGDSTLELAVLAKKMIETTNDEIYVGVYLDSVFFENIAKIRALRLLATKINQELDRNTLVKIVALTSFENWSLYERYSNILRNETSVASAYIGGADHVQSSGYQSLFEIETTAFSQDEHYERSKRIARNTTHILALESMLGIVEDAAFGSYHLENLTHYMCEESWKCMQRILNGEELTSDAIKMREKKLELIKKRKKIISGINDFPNPHEDLRIELKNPRFFRSSRVFEELRLKMEKINRPKVFIALFGDYATLNARLNFTKNFFGLLGLDVIDLGQSSRDVEKFESVLKSRTEDIIAFCATDEDYPLLYRVTSQLNTKHLYVAGKIQIDGCKNIFSGQNIFEGLQELVASLGRG